MDHDPWLDTATTFDWALRGKWAGHTGPILATAAFWVAVPLAAGTVRTIRREVT